MSKQKSPTGLFCEVNCKADGFGCTNLTDLADLNGFSL